MEQMTLKIKDAAAYIRNKMKEQPEIGLILGSGLGILAEDIEDGVAIKYKEIPHFPISTVEGHAGELVVGKLNGREVLLMKGRFHLYEGYNELEVTFPVRVMKELGIHTIVVTNAAGGINTSFEPGDLMLIEDHINMMARNPLIGPNDDTLGLRFPDMSEAYSKELRARAVQTAEENGITLKKGVYIGVLGPTFETPAEIRMMRGLGADAVGMSTVPEVIVANHAGLNVLGISCITNMASGILQQPLNHEEVMETAEKVKEQFKTLVYELIPKL